jgi:hypothetical protein
MKDGNVCRRRGVLLAAAVALLGMAAFQEPEAEAVLVGEGVQRYRWDEGWLQAPGGDDLGNTHGDVVVGPDGNVYFNTDTERAVMVFAPDGSFVRSFGNELAGGLHGMALVERDGEVLLYLAHTGRHEVLLADLEGSVRATLGWPEASGHYESADQFRPTGVAVAPNGDVYVADGYGLSWIHRYDSAGAYVSSFGGPGTEPGKLRTPHGIWIDTRGAQPRLLVADRENGRLQSFDLEGNHVEVLDVELRRPCMVKERGGYLVVPDLAGRVTILDANNELVCHLGDNPDPARRANNGVPRTDWQVGHFLAPHSAAWDADGNLIVMDWNRFGRVSRLERLPAQKR